MSEALTINVDLHPNQQTVFEALRNQANSEVWIRKGRRFGATYCVSLAATEFAIANPTSPGLPGKPTEIGLFGPQYKSAKRVFQEVLDSFGSTLASFRESDLTFIWQGGARGTVFSGDNADSARGYGFDIAIIDEAANFPEQAIRSVIVPALADRGGRLWILSSPLHGKSNHFSVGSLRAESGALPGVVGFHFTSFDNPRLSRTWLEGQRQSTPELTFREEYLAEVLDSSSSWLDPSLIQYIPSEQIPGNVYTTLHGDFAWATPEPGMIDKTARQRKDANVLAPMSQDALGNVYLRKHGTYAKYADPDRIFEDAGRYIKEYGILKFCVEREVNVSRSTDDMFGRLWRAYQEKHSLPNVGMVRPVRRAHWKAPAIRMWSVLLTRKKFFIEQGAALAPHLIEEMTSYSEAASASDRVHDDVLVAVSDILLPGIWQGRLENETMREVTGGVDRYHLRQAWDAVLHPDDNQYQPRMTKYSSA